MINDNIQGSITKHLCWDGLLYYKFIIQFANKRIFKIGEHLAKLQAKWLIASFALHFWPQRRRIRHVSKITCVLWTETVTNFCYVIGRLTSAYYQLTINKYQTAVDQFWLTDDWQTDWRHQRLANYWSCIYSILLWQFFFVTAVVYSHRGIFFISLMWTSFC